MESRASGIAARSFGNPPVKTLAAPAEIVPKNVLRLIAGKICCRCEPSIETHSLPALARCYPHSFTFYVAYPIRSILTCLPRDEPAVVGRAVALAKAAL